MKLSSLLSDGMVLQRDVQLPYWGQEDGDRGSTL